MTTYQLSVRHYDDHPGNGQNFYIEGLPNLVHGWDFAANKPTQSKQPRTMLMNISNPEGNSNDSVESISETLYEQLYDELQVNVLLKDGDEFIFPGGRVNKYRLYDDSLGAFDIPPMKFKAVGPHIVKCE